MAILSNTPTLGYIYFKDMIITYNNIPYQIQNTYTCKPYIYWDYSDPYKLIFSNTIIKAIAGRFYICFNESGNPTLVPQTDIEITFSENVSRDLISERITSFQGGGTEADEKRFTAIEQSIDGIKQTVGTIQENVEGNSQSISTLQQTSESVVANVSALDRKFNEDAEAKELRDNISKALLSLQSVIGIFSSDMNKYMEDNRLSDVERSEITSYIDEIETSNLELNIHLDTIISALRANGQIDKANTLSSQKGLLNTAITNLKMNISNSIVDEKFTNAEISTIISYFSNITSKITETKNLVDEYIFLGVGGDLIEEVGKMSIRQNQISLSVSRTESTLKNSLNLSKFLILDIIASNNTALNNLKNCLSIIIDDRDVSQEEKDSLQVRIDAMNEAFDGLTNKKDEIISHALIGQIEKEELINIYDELISKYNEMKSVINNALEDNAINDTEIIDINEKTNKYYTLLNEIHNAMCKAIDVIETNAISKEIADAKGELNAEINELDNRINNLILNIDGAVVSGLIDKQEKDNILQNLETLKREKLDIDNRFNEWYSSSFLYGNLKESYRIVYNVYVDKYNTLYNLSETIANKKDMVTEEERLQIEVATNALLSALDSFFRESEVVISTITSNEINYIKSNLSREFEDINSTLNILNSQLDSSFKDGIITEVELKNIEFTLNQIDKEYYDINKIFNELYNNNNLKS